MYSFSMFILESLDSSYNIKRNDELSDKLQTIYDEGLKTGGPKHTDVHVYDIDENMGRFHTSYVNNAVELHHIRPGKKLGKLENSSTKIKWISTAYKLLKQHALDKNRNIRILGTDDLVPHYRKMVQYLSKKHNMGWNETTFQHNNKTISQFDLYESLLDSEVASILNEGIQIKCIFYNLEGIL